MGGVVRDPLVDPQPGDRVKMYGITYRVYELYPEDGRMDYQRDEPKWATIFYNTTIHYWRSWCQRNKAEVVKEADGG